MPIGSTPPPGEMTTPPSPLGGVGVAVPTVVVPTVAPTPSVPAVTATGVSATVTPASADGVASPWVSAGASGASGADGTAGVSDEGTEPPVSPDPGVVLVAPRCVSDPVVGAVP